MFGTSYIVIFSIHHIYIVFPSLFEQIKFLRFLDFILVSMILLSQILLIHSSRSNG